MYISDNINSYSKLETNYLIYSKASAKLSGLLTSFVHGECVHSALFNLLLAMVLPRCGWVDKLAGYLE